jgi:hypothetical protein
MDAKYALMSSYVLKLILDFSLRMMDMLPDVIKAAPLAMLT